MNTLRVADGSERPRLDVFLTEAGAVPSRAQARRWIDDGLVRVNGAFPSKAGLKLAPGDVVQFSPPEPLPAGTAPERIPLDIVYEDDHIVVVNKAKGMVVHPAPGHWGGTLVNALLHHCPTLEGVGGVRRPGIVHRLDKETSGLLVAAKTDVAHRGLVQALKARRVTRVYLALVHGRPPTERGTIDAPVGRHPVARQRMAVLERGGRDAVTHFAVLEDFGRYSFLELKLETGRTHQIRVHLEHIGHPVVGDTKYGPKRAELFDDGHALHAARLSFLHPIQRVPVEFAAPLPNGFEQVLRTLRADRT